MAAALDSRDSPHPQGNWSVSGISEASSQLPEAPEGCSLHLSPQDAGGSAFMSLLHHVLSTDLLQGLSNSPFPESPRGQQRRMDKALVGPGCDWK